MYLKGSIDKPSVYLSIEESIFEIKGNSFYIGIQDIYDQIINWIDNELPKLKTVLECKFHFHTLNSTTIKSLIKIFEKLSYYKDEGKDIKIKWIYDKNDTDNYDIAHDILNFTTLDMNIIERN